MVDLALLPVWLAAAERRWQEVVRIPETTRLQFPKLEPVFGVAALEWLLREAHEHLDRLDEAARHFERAATPRD